MKSHFARMGADQSRQHATLGDDKMGTFSGPPDPLPTPLSPTPPGTSFASANSVEPLTWAFNLLQRIRQSLDLEVVLHTTVTEVRQLLQVERVFLFQFQPDWSGTAVVEDCAPHCLPLQGRRVYDDCFAKEWVSAYTQGRVQTISDIYQANLTPCHRDLLASLQVRANLVVPLQVNGQLWGLLVAQHCTAPRPWQAEEVQIMQQLALQVGMAIQQSELHQQVKAELDAHKQAEAQLLQQAQQSYNRHLESIGTLAGGLAHDLSDILTPIVLAAEMLKQPRLNSQQQQQWLNRIRTSARRGVSLADQVLSFAAGMSGQRTEIQLAYVLGELVQTLQEVRPSTVQVASRLRQPHLWTVDANAAELQQVFMNLCLNALEAMPEGGLLQVEASNVWWRGTTAHPQPGAYVKVAITDTGTGMSPAVCDRSCEPFFTTRAQSGHSGLGLSTAQGLVKGHGGWLEVCSQPATGTTVAVYLPALVADIEIDAYGDDLPICEGQEGAQVLLVMAEDGPRELLRAILESYSYTVLLAEEGADAIALYIQHQADLSAVVLDLTLPTFNGPTMLRRMHQIAPQLPLIAVGGSPASAQGLAAGHLVSPAISALLSVLAQVQS
jgi:signal transduction histidine kinase/CheY-like chemotaxis protein